MAEFKNLGAFWTAKDKKYKLSGTLEINGQKLKCFMFKNEKKSKETHPDYNLSVEVAEGTTSAPAAPAPSVNDVDF